MTTLAGVDNGREPTGMKVAPSSYAKIEAAADSLRPLLPVVAGTQFALDGWRILERTLPKANFNYRIAEIEELPDCAAYTIPERKLIVMRVDVYDGLFEDSRFSHSTVVHELAHIALGHAVTLRRGPPITQHRFFEDSEWQAKAMTAALMMPLAACRQAKNATELAALCGTSVQAATYRLERLRKGGFMK